MRYPFNGLWEMRSTLQCYSSKKLDVVTPWPVCVCCILEFVKIRNMVRYGRVGCGMVWCQNKEWEYWKRKEEKKKETKKEENRSKLKRSEEMVMMIMMKIEITTNFLCFLLSQFSSLCSPLFCLHSKSYFFTILWLHQICSISSIPDQ